MTPERPSSRPDREGARPASGDSAGEIETQKMFVAFSTVVDTFTKPRTPGLASDWTFAQRAFVALGWAMFLWAWVTVMSHTAPQTVVVTAILLAAGAAAAEAIDLLWIRHNLNIYRKKGPRKSVPQVRHEYSRDFLGRTLLADWRSLLEGDLIVVDFDERRKTFAPHRHGLEDKKVARSLKPRVVPASPEEEEAI